MVPHTDDVDRERDWVAIFQGFVTLDSETIVVSVAIIMFNLSIHVAYRYVPEYLRLFGADAWLLGLFGSMGLLFRTVYPYLDNAVPEWVGARHVVTVVGGLTSLGLLLWLVALPLERRLGIVACSWMFLGLIFAALWPSLGLPMTFAIIPQDTHHEQVVPDVVSTLLFRWTGLLIGFILAVGLFTKVSAFVAGFQVWLALAVSVGIMTTLLQDLYSGKTNTGNSFHGMAHRLAGRADLSSLPADHQRLLIGDTVVEFAHGMVSIFFVTVVTSVLHIDATVLGHHLDPAAVFGVLLAVERSVALLGIVPTTQIAHYIGLKPVMTTSFLISTVFPLALVSAPANVGVLGLLFAGFGVRLASRPARQLFIKRLTTRQVVGEVTGTYRVARRVVVIPSPVIGGVLYGIDPGLAFGVASAVSLVGTGIFLQTSR